MSIFAEPVRARATFDDEQIMICYRGVLAPGEQVIPRDSDWIVTFSAPVEVDRIEVTTHARSLDEAPFEIERGLEMAVHSSVPATILFVDPAQTIGRLQVVTIRGRDGAEIDSFRIERGAEWSWRPPGEPVAITGLSRLAAELGKGEDQAIVE